jgi:hypothetical protein
MLLGLLSISIIYILYNRLCEWAGPLTGLPFYCFFYAFLSISYFLFYSFYFILFFSFHFLLTFLEK